jgi:LacI family transcriptional regulator
MANLSDVALLAGVSISAVSRVLTDAPGARVSQQTRERIKAAAAELNYRPNFAGRALRSSRTNVIALLAPDLTNAFLTELMLGVEEEATRRDYMLLLGRSEDLQPGGEMISRLVMEGRVDGMLVQVGDTTSPQQIEELVRADLPVTFINSIDAGERSGVVLQDEEGARIATQHLIDIGHTRIGFVGGLSHTYTAKRRLAGFQSTMRSAGLKVSRPWLTTLGYQPHQGGAALRRIMSQTPPPTALVVANVNAAIGALKESRQLGLSVPEDLSMISVHDAWTAENTWPPLTAVKMPMYQLGQAAVAALYNRLHNLPVQGHVVSDPAPLLMLRESTRPV